MILYDLPYVRLERLPCLKHSQAIDPSFVTITKPLSNKIEETFCEGLKWICKFFEIKGQKTFKNLVISRNPQNTLLKNLPPEKFVLILLSFIVDIGNFCPIFFWVIAETTCR